MAIREALGENEKTEGLENWAKIKQDGDALLAKEAKARGITVDELVKMTFQGNNAFRLNNATNTAGVATYTFDTGLGATNYARLELVNGNTAWRSTRLTIGSGGSMLVSNTRATISGLVTNLGLFTSRNAQATFQGAVVLFFELLDDCFV